MSDSISIPRTATSTDLNISFLTPLTIIHQQQQPTAPVRAIFTIQHGGITATGENMSSQMQVGTYATVSVTWKDAGGNVVGVEGGSIKWDSSDQTIVQCTVATGNPAIANLYAPGKIGKVTIQATGDADLGQGVKSVTASYDVEVISGEAVGGEIKFTQTPAQGAPNAQTGGKPAAPPRR